MKLALPVGTTSQIVHVFIQDSTVTTGAGKTALVFGDITAYYVRAGGTLTALTMETIATLGTWASTGNDKLGFKLMHDTNAPGLYELDLPNNILAAGATQATIQLRATGAAIAPIEIQLAPVPADVVHVHGTALTEAGGAGRLAAAISTFGDVATPVFTATCVNQTIDNPTAAAIGTDAAGKVLVTPAQKLVTDASGNVTLANGIHGGAAATLTLLSAVVNNSAGVGLSVTGSTNGMACAGGTGPGLVLTSTSDAGLKSTGGTNHPAAELLGTGTGAGLEATGGLTGNGVKASGGATSGAGIYANAQNNNDAGMELVKHGTGKDIDADETDDAAADALAAHTAVDALVTTVGVAGAGLTALGDARLANLDATVSSRTKPADTQAAVTLVATCTNLTNSPANGDLTATMKASVMAAVPTAAVVADAVCDEAINTGHAVANSVGKILYDNLNAPVATVDTVVDGLATTLGAAGAGLTALGDTRLANLDAAVTTRSSHAAADVVTALEVNGSKLDHLWEMTEDDAGTRRLTANALEQAPAGGGGGDATAANQTTIINHLTDIKGTDFVKDTNSLVNVTGVAATNITVETTVTQ